MSANAKTPIGADRYFDLVRAFPLRPIRDDEDHRRAVEALDRLIDRGPARSPEEEDYMMVLGLLIERYESTLFDYPEFSGVDRLRFLMEENGLTQARLSGETGIPIQSLSDILRGKRNISPKVRKMLCERFGTPASFFV